jgi:hypothetical protein
VPQRRAWWPALALVGFLPLLGCYEYVLVEPSAVPREAQVRARLTEQEISRLRLREIVPLEDQTIQGRVLSTGGGSLGVLVPVVPEFGSAYPRTDLGQQIQIDMSGVVETRLQRLNKLRTGLVTGLGLALFTSFIIDNFSGWFGSNREVPGPDKDGVM